jgi:hypothetical protein
MRLALLVLCVPVLVAAQGLPSPRNSHVLAASSDGTILFGGANSSAPRARDTTWTLGVDGWRSHGDAGPAARNMPALAFDSRRNVVVLYGGSGIGSGTRYGDTWEWDGTRWAERVVRTPGPRDHHAMAFDSARGVTVAYGGNGSPGTWTWDGTVWRLADSVTGPGNLAHHAMAYDSRRERIVMYGGFPIAGGPRAGDTWEWDGERWEKAVTGASPGARSHHRMAYDAARGTIVLFGGGDSTATETWTYDGRRWSRHDVPGPPARWSGAMAYDLRRKRIVLFGGGRSARPFGSLGDTWEWDGALWHQVPR